MKTNVETVVNKNFKMHLKLRHKRRKNHVIPQHFIAAIDVRDIIRALDHLFMYFPLYTGDMTSSEDKYFAIVFKLGENRVLKK